MLIDELNHRPTEKINVRWKIILWQLNDRITQTTIRKLKLLKIKEQAIISVGGRYTVAGRVE